MSTAFKHLALRKSITVAEWRHLKHSLTTLFPLEWSHNGVFSLPTYSGVNAITALQWWNSKTVLYFKTFIIYIKMYYGSKCVICVVNMLP